MVTLVIGNGFDMDLGLPTGFHSFFDSIMGSMYQNDNRLKSYILSNINKPAKEKNWYDLEGMLDVYATKDNDIRENIDVFNRLNYTPSEDEAFFNWLKTELKKYISKVAFETSINYESLSCYFLDLIFCKHKFHRVYTFNYTDMTGIYRKNMKKASERVDPIHLHGSVDTDIILGIRDDVETPQELSFLYKSWDSQYTFHDLPNALYTSSTIMFFGFGFSPIDNIYFESFFKSLMLLDVTNLKHKDKKHIIIITKDEKSKNNILWNLKKIGISMTEIYARVWLSFLFTKHWDENKDRDDYRNLIHAAIKAGTPVNPAAIL